MKSLFSKGSRSFVSQSGHGERLTEFWRIERFKPLFVHIPFRLAIYGMVTAREPQGISNEFLKPELLRLSKNFRENQRLKPNPTKIKEGKSYRKKL